MSKQSQRSALSLILSAFLTACSGGSSNAAIDQGQFSGTVIAGSRAVAARNRIFVIDMGTRVAHLFADMSAAPNAASLYEIDGDFTLPSYANEGSVVVGFNRFIFGAATDEFCIDIVDSNNVVDRLVPCAQGSVVNAPSVSPDGTLIAAQVATSQSAPTSMRLYGAATGSIVEEFLIGERHSGDAVSNVVWTRDSRMVFGVKLNERSTGLVVTEPRSFALSDDHPIGEFLVDPSGESSIGALSLSVDGRTLAYDVNPDIFAEDQTRRSFVVDIETGSTTPIATENSGNIWAPA